MTIACSKEYTLSVASPCVDWDSMTWTGLLITGTVDIAVFDKATYHTRIAYADVAHFGSVAEAIGEIIHTSADTCHCLATMTFDRTAAFEHAGCGFKLYQDATLKVDFNVSAYPIGPQVATFNFDIDPGVGSVIQIRPRYFDFIKTNYTSVAFQIGYVEYQLAVTNV